MTPPDEDAIRTVSRLVYGRHVRICINPTEFEVPRLAAQLADTWCLLGEEIPGSIDDVARAIRFFVQSVGSQLALADRRHDFGLADIRARHFDAWEASLVEWQRRIRRDGPYRRAVHLMALLRRIDDDQPDVLHPSLKERLGRETRLSHVRGPGLPDHSDAEVKAILRAGRRVLGQALRTRYDPGFRVGPDLVLALNTLLVLACGEPPEVVRGISLGDIVATPLAGCRSIVGRSPDETLGVLAAIDGVQQYAVTLTKARAGARYVRVYDRDTDRPAHRAITAAIVITSHLRSETPDRSLWLVETRSGTQQPGWHDRQWSLSGWYARHVTGIAISQPHVFARLRKVPVRQQALNDPVEYLHTGRNHSVRTFFDHYTNSPILRAESGRVLVDAITERFHAATSDSGQLVDHVRAGGADGVEAQLTVNPATLDLADQGSCAPQPAGEGGQATGPDPQHLIGRCVACPNAVLTVHHLPALVLAEQMTDPEAGMEDVTWAQVWGPVSASVRDLLDHFPSGAVDEARRSLARRGTKHIDGDDHS